MKENQKESLWEYSYRLETENIHVPESLKDKTLEAMRQAMEEEPKRHRKKNWAAAGILAAAACLCLVLLGNYTGLLGGTGDEIHVAKVAEQAGQWDLEMNLGQAGSSEEEEEARDGISVQEVPSAKFLPQGLWEAPGSEDRQRFGSILLVCGLGKRRRLLLCRRGGYEPGRICGRIEKNLEKSVTF